MQWGLRITVKAHIERSRFIVVAYIDRQAEIMDISHAGGEFEEVWVDIREDIFGLKRYVLLLGLSTCMPNYWLGSFVEIPIHIEEFLTDMEAMTNAYMHWKASHSAAGWEDTSFRSDPAESKGMEQNIRVIDVFRDSDLLFTKTANEAVTAALFKCGLIPCAPQ